MELSRIDLRRFGVGVALALLVGCTSESPPAPSTLIDGAPARPSPLVLEGIGGPRIATSLRVTLAGSSGAQSTGASCPSVDMHDGPVVERTGVSGASITFFDPGRRGLHACDASGFDSRGAERWCAHAFGRLASGRLRDPRLTITCRDAGDEPLGFAWVQPGSKTAYVVVRQRGYAEVYPVSGMTPVRVSTADVELASSRATFAISEHARDGSRIRWYDLEAQVAG